VARSTQAAWQEAGEAWEARACDWAYLADGFARSGYEAVFAAADVGAGTRLLDVACGAGLAAWLAAERGASVAGIDASEALLRIAEARVPDGDFRVGDMAELPWPDDSFDAATAFNGIWAGNDDALKEACRVVRPGGRVSLLFFGPGRIDHASYLIALASLKPPNEIEAAGSLLDIATPGTAEAMMDKAGITPSLRSSVEGTSEWPDAEVAWRAAAATGLAWAALTHSGEEATKAAVVDALEPYHQAGLGYRLTTEFDFLMGEVRAR
jgi:SAM-dependent methyltransferase